MSDPDDPFAGLDGDGSGPAYSRSYGWRSDGARDAFWLLAGTAAFVLCLAWLWYGLAFNEEMTEQCKSLAAGDSESGTGLLFGVPPLVLAHAVFLVSLLLVGRRNHERPSTGALLGLVALVAASALGVALNELLWAGELFTMSAAHAQCHAIDP